MTRRVISPCTCSGPVPAGFVDLCTLPGVRLDIRYATSNNFTGAPLPGYAVAGAWLRARPARALEKVARGLKSKGLGVVVFDAYRPSRASRAMVDWAKRSGKDKLVEADYISPVSRHNMGVAIDLSLWVLKTGAPLEMGSDFDDFSRRSHTRNAKGSILRNRLLLKKEMEKQGFRGCSTEWWHFSYEDPGARVLDWAYRERRCGDPGSSGDPKNS